MSTKFGVRFSDELDASLRSWAKANDMTVSAALRVLLSTKLTELSGETDQQRAWRKATFEECKIAAFARFQGEIQKAISNVMHNLGVEEQADG